MSEQNSSAAAALQTTDSASSASEAEESDKAVFRTLIRGTLDQVWNELTKTNEVQKAMFNSRLETPGLEPGAPMRMRSPNGKYTAVVGEVIEVDRPLRFSHTFRFTSYDDPLCTVIYDLKQVAEGVEFTLTVEHMPLGTKTAKQMSQGGAMICNTLKSVIETGKPPIGTRLLYVLFKLMEPFSPKRCRSENWPLESSS